jgi:methylmalonyl-CoA/ethylmalonyl-CoA epimerase
VLRRVHHVGLVVRRLEDGLAFWQDRLGLSVSKQATVRDQGVRAALLPIGRSEIELLEPIDAAGGVAKFLARRGEGLHHVCFETGDVGAELGAARAQGFPLIDEAPRAGLAGMICFLHPKGTRGVLVEFATPPPEDAAHAHAASTRIPGLALDEIVARSRDAESAATLFAERLGLERAPGGAEPGLVRAAVQTGGVRLVFASADPRSVGAGAAAWTAALEEHGEGLFGLVLGVGNVGTAAAALGAPAPAPDAGTLRLDPAHCHGVPLTLRSAP